MNLRGNPHVILTTGCNHWEEGLDVVVEGDAIQVTDDDVLERLAVAWATKWNGQWQFQVHDGSFQHPSGGTPTKVFAFAKGHFSHTRHQF